MTVVTELLKQIQFSREFLDEETFQAEAVIEALTEEQHKLELKLKQAKLEIKQKKARKKKLTNKIDATNLTVDCSVASSVSVCGSEVNESVRPGRRAGDAAKQNILLYGKWAKTKGSKKDKTILIDSLQPADGKRETSKKRSLSASDAENIKVKKSKIQTEEFKRPDSGVVNIKKTKLKNKNIEEIVDDEIIRESVTARSKTINDITNLPSCSIRLTRLALKEFDDKNVSFNQFLSDLNQKNRSSNKNKISLMLESTMVVDKKKPSTLLKASKRKLTEVLVQSEVVQNEEEVGINKDEQIGQHKCQDIKPEVVDDVRCTGRFTAKPAMVICATPENDISTTDNVETVMKKYETKQASKITSEKIATPDIKQTPTCNVMSSTPTDNNLVSPHHCIQDVTVTIPAHTGANLTCVLDSPNNLNATHIIPNNKRTKPVIKPRVFVEAGKNVIQAAVATTVDPPSVPKPVVQETISQVAADTDCLKNNSPSPQVHHKKRTKATFATRKVEMPAAVSDIECLPPPPPSKVQTEETQEAVPPIAVADPDSVVHGSPSQQVLPKKRTKAKHATKKVIDLPVMDGVLEEIQSPVVHSKARTRAVAKPKMFDAQGNQIELEGSQDEGSEVFQRVTRSKVQHKPTKTPLDLAAKKSLLKAKRISGKAHQEVLALVKLNSVSKNQPSATKSLMSSSKYKILMTSANKLQSQSVVKMMKLPLRPVCESAQKDDRLKLKILREDEVSRKKEEAMKLRQEEMRRKNELKLKMTAERREHMEKEKQKQILAFEKEKEEKQKVIQQEREQQKKDEILKKKLIAQQKTAEVEERRRLEMEARLAQLKEKEEEEKRIAREQQEERERVEKRAAERAKEEEWRRLNKEMERKMKIEEALRSKREKKKRKYRCYKSRNENDRGIEDEISGDEDDVHKRNDLPIPAWARGSNLKKLSERTLAVTVANTGAFSHYYYYEDKTPDLVKLFGMSPSKVKHRTSSAVWTSTPELFKKSKGKSSAE